MVALLSQVVYSIRRYISVMRFLSVSVQTYILFVSILCNNKFYQKKPYFRCHGSTYFLHFFHFFSALAIITVNSVALYIFGKNPKLKTPQHLYRINLAVADLMLGIFAFFPSVYFANRKFNSEATINKEFTYLYDKSDVLRAVPNTLERFLGFVRWLSLLVSGYILIVASFDRLLATIVPKLYFKHNNCKITKVVCVVGWIISACGLTAYFDPSSSIITSPYFAGEASNRANVIQSLALNTLSYVSMVATSSIVMLVLYFRNRYVFLLNYLKNLKLNYCS